MFAFVRIPCLLGFLFLVVMISPCAIWGNEPAMAPANTDAYRTAVEQETFDLINQYRRANQLPLLQWNNAIAGVSRGHSKDMADDEVDFGHDGFSKRVTDLKKDLIGMQGAGENVLRTNDPEHVARAAVSLWLKSPHHLKNIRGDYNYSGLGVWVDKEGMIYFTQIFVKLGPPPSINPPPAEPPPKMRTPLTYLAPPTARP